MESDQENNSMYEASSPTTPTDKDPLEDEEVEEREVTESSDTDVPIDPTKLEENVMQVEKRLRRGCNCQDGKCFCGLNPGNVYKHRWNIAHLTKSEHDMYLMGITIASMGNLETTCRYKERKRIRFQYVHCGRHVCLDAFMYLENCTHYHLKRIRKHVMMNGVVPRVHGNQGRKLHNTLRFDIYRHATEFLIQHLEQYAINANFSDPKKIIKLPSDVTQKVLYEAYKVHGTVANTGVKLMGRSTFGHFLRTQFPQLLFSKNERKEQSVERSPQMEINEPQTAHSPLQIPVDERVEDSHEDQLENYTTVTNTMQQVTPLVLVPAYDDANAAQQYHQTIFVRPVQYLLSTDVIPAAIQSTNSQDEISYYTPLVNSTYFNN